MEEMKRLEKNAARSRVKDLEPADCVLPAIVWRSPRPAK
jgi:hypothetical protein